MILEDIAYITCSCGEKFQVLNQDKTDWDEAETSKLYQEHLKKCGEK